MYNRTGNTASIRTLHRGVNEKIDYNQKHEVSIVLSMNFKIFDICLKRVEDELELSVSEKSGMAIYTKYHLSIEKAWIDLLQHFNLSSEGVGWLRFGYQFSDEKGFKFLLKKLSKVFGNLDFESPKQKQSFEYWLNRLAY